jgi:hypothetical protein
MTKSLVINPPFIEPHRPPISVAIVAELLRLENHDVTVKDINIELFHDVGKDRFYDIQIISVTQDLNASLPSILKVLAQELQDLDLTQFDWVFISCFSYWNNMVTEKICQWLRSRTKAKIAVGGPGIEYEQFGQYLHATGVVDYYIVGEGEHSLPQLVRGNTSYPGINGIPAQQIDDIENLPLPNYGFFNLNRYDWLLESPDVFIEGSRGCVRKCTFCDVETYWPKFRWRSGESIAQEMINNYELYGINNYFFADSLVNGNLKEYRRMCEILASYKENLFRWGSYAIVRPRAHHPASWFDLTKAAGGRFFSVGIETGVDRIRFEMDKKFTNADIDWHLEQSQRTGIQNNFLNMPTWPTETLAEHQEYLAMFKRWRNFAVDGTIFGIRISSTTTALPGTRLQSQHTKMFDLDHAAYTDYPEIKWAAWKVASNPDLTHKEKLRRTLAIYEAAIKNDWPLTNKIKNLQELRFYIEAFSKAAKVTENALSRKIIPITLAS